MKYNKAKLVQAANARIAEINERPTLRELQSKGLREALIKRLSETMESDANPMITIKVTGQYRDEEEATRLQDFVDYICLVEDDSLNANEIRIPDSLTTKRPYTHPVCSAMAYFGDVPSAVKS